MTSHWVDIRGLGELTELSILEPADYSLMLLEKRPNLMTLGCYRWGNEHKVLVNDHVKADSVTKELEPFAARLEKFVFQPSEEQPEDREDDDDEEEKDLDDFWYTLTSLRHFASPLSTRDDPPLRRLPTILAKIPTQLELLHVFTETASPRAVNWTDLLGVLRKQPPSLARLRHLIIPACAQGSILGEIEIFCDERGVQLERSADAPVNR